jgi:mannose-1-phosphate guanylyltransferase/phosphomannomutase
LREYRTRVQEFVEQEQGVEVSIAHLEGLEARS